MTKKIPNPPEGLASVGRILDWTNSPEGRLPVSCTVLHTDESKVEEAIRYVSKGLRFGAGVAVDLSGFHSVPPANFTWGWTLHPGHPDYTAELTKHPNFVPWEKRDDDSITPFGVITVNDSMESYAQGTPKPWISPEVLVHPQYLTSIEDSWICFYAMARMGTRVVIDLSHLRPSGNDNTRGIVASGPLSFLEVFEALAVYSSTGYCWDFLYVLSALNGTLRRGGLYKNGAITAYCSTKHPEVMAYLGFPSAKVPWVKKALYVYPEEFLDFSKPLGEAAPRIPTYDIYPEKLPLVQAIMEQVANGTLWLAKPQWDRAGQRLYSNVCVTKDTWVQTSEGPRQVSDLIGKPFTAMVDGEGFRSMGTPWRDEQGNQGQFANLGFFLTGTKPTVKLSTREGYQIQLTSNHRVMTPSGWVEAGSLTPGRKVLITSQSGTWGGRGTKDQGWLLGNLLGNGTFSRHGDKDTAKLVYWGDNRSEALAAAVARIEPRRNGATPKGHCGPVTAAVTSASLTALACEFDMHRGHKQVTPKVEQSSYEFYQGFLQGYYDADGTVNKGQKGGNGKSIGLTSISLEDLKAVQRMLSRLGITSRIWANNYNGGENLLPDGKGGTKLYQTKPASRLDISGRQNLQRFSEVVGFGHPEKSAKLDTLLSTYVKTAYRKNPWATVSSVEDSGTEDVYDCTIESIHAFDANGLYVENCLEILLKSMATCLLSHINLGIVKYENLPQVFKSSMKYLCELHPHTGAGKDNYYLKPKDDRQVGLGLLGLANFLARYKVDYQLFVATLEDAVEALVDAVSTRGWLGNQNTLAAFEHLFPRLTMADKLCHALIKGYHEAAIVAREYQMDRAFTVAPCASVGWRYRDENDYGIAPEIAPPMGKSAQRLSATTGHQQVEYPPGIETVMDVDYLVVLRLQELIQEIMDATGLAHSQSSNIWNTQVVDVPYFTRFLCGPLKTTYYYLQVTNVSALDKSQFATDTAIDVAEPLYLDIGDDSYKTWLLRAVNEVTLETVSGFGDVTLYWGDGQSLEFNGDSSPDLSQVTLQPGDELVITLEDAMPYDCLVLKTKTGTLALVENNCSSCAE